MKQRPKETVSPPEIQLGAIDYEDKIEGDSAVSTRKALTDKSTHIHRQVHVPRSRTPERKGLPGRCAGGTRVVPDRAEPTVRPPLCPLVHELRLATSLHSLGKNIPNEICRRQRNTKSGIERIANAFCRSVDFSVALSKRLCRHLHQVCGSWKLGRHQSVECGSVAAVFSIDLAYSRLLRAPSSSSPTLLPTA